jgi:carboxyl-terminal processing protease
LLNRMRWIPVPLAFLLAIAGLVNTAVAREDRKPHAARLIAPARVKEPLSSKDRREVFEEVWETVNEKYHDPAFNGVNWRAVRERYRPLIERTKSADEFYDVMKNMVGELHDAHTRFHTPRERREREQLKAVSAGLSIGEVEGETVVIGVAPDSQAARSGVEAGMIVRSVDGKPVADRLAEAHARIGGTSTERAEQLRLFRQLVEGDTSNSLHLDLERPDGSRFNVTLPRRVVDDTAKVSSKRLPSGIGYIKLNLWKSPVQKDFKRALEALRDAPGLIVDLRGNPGGEANVVVKIAGYFFNSHVSFGQFTSRSGRAISFYTSDDDQVYSGPLAILINEGSGSGSELFSGVMQENNRATIIGRQSCGCVLGIARYKKLRGGSELAVSELRYISPQGRKFEGTGVAPDKAIALTLTDLRQRRDAALEAAENFLKTSKPAIGRAQSN